MPGWVVGIVAWMLLSALGEYKRGGKLSFYRRFCLQKPLTHFGKKPRCVAYPNYYTFTCVTLVTLPRLLVDRVVISFLPLLREYVLGNAGSAIFALHASLALPITTGLVGVSWCALYITM